MVSPAPGTPSMTNLDDEGAAWFSAMRRGDFEAAWRLSNRALARQLAVGPDWHLPRNRQWVWDGRPVVGQRVLVRCYHGLGDTVMCARFLPALGQVARDVTVWAQPSLLPLLATLPGERRLLPLHNGTPDVEYDVDVESLELPHLLRVTLATLPARVPYLHVPPAPRPSPTFNVGVVAQAGEWDPRRSVRPDQLRRLADVPGTTLYNLQPGGSVPGAADLSSPDPLVAAARVQSLDLVVTVDTFMAHLAGALGAPVWTLLGAEADWRWMTERADSPWYPTMRLFRQRTADDWGPVVEDVVAALRQRVARPAEAAGLQPA